MKTTKVIAMAKNPVGHARTKHIDIRYHFVHEGVQNGAIILKYVPTDEMIADILSKPLPKHPFEKLVIGLGMKLSNKQRQKWECCYCENDLDLTVAKSNFDVCTLT